MRLAQEVRRERCPVSVSIEANAIVAFMPIYLEVLQSMKLVAEQRTTLGKKVKALRRSGVVPANLFGKGLESVALQLRSEDLKDVIRNTGRNDILDLDIQSEGKSVRSTNVMVRRIQREPMKGQIVHVDLYQVNMANPIEVDVAVELIGDAPAVTDRLGTLQRGVATVRVHGLPNQVPSMIEVDVSGLVEASQGIRAEELTLPEGVTLISEPTQAVANIVAVRGRTAAEAEEAAAAEEAEAASAASTETTAESGDGSAS